MTCMSPFGLTATQAARQQIPSSTGPDGAAAAAANTKSRMHGNHRSRRMFAELSLRTSPSFVDPLAHLRNKIILAQRRLRAAFSGRPRPKYERCLEMIDDIPQAFSTVAQRVLHLPAQLTR